MSQGTVGRWSAKRSKNHRTNGFAYFLLFQKYAILRFQPKGICSGDIISLRKMTKDFVLVKQIRPFSAVFGHVSLPTSALAGRGSSAMPPSTVRTMRGDLKQRLEGRGSEMEAEQWRTRKGGELGGDFIPIFFPTPCWEGQGFFR